MGKWKWNTHVYCNDSDDGDQVVSWMLKISSDQKCITMLPSFPQKGCLQCSTALAAVPSMAFGVCKDTWNEQRNISANTDAGEIQTSAKCYPISVCILIIFVSVDAPLIDPQDSTLRAWTGSTNKPGYHKEFLLEDLQCKGWGDGVNEKCCEKCQVKGLLSAATATPTIWCDMCMGGLIECQACCVRWHQQLPCHRIQVSMFMWLTCNIIFWLGIQKWNSVFFKKTLLKELGLVVQLGHSVDMHCVNLIKGQTDFLIINVNGIHWVDIYFCGCEQQVSDRQQILRAGWFPAMLAHLKTACTLQVLRQFHSLTLCGKLSAYEYYRSLESLTNNTGIDLPKVCDVAVFFMAWSQLTKLSADLLQGIP